jgi:hypothetical protein
MLPGMTFKQGITWKSLFRASGHNTARSTPREIDAVRVSIKKERAVMDRHARKPIAAIQMKVTSLAAAGRIHMRRADMIKVSRIGKPQKAGLRQNVWRTN